MPTLKCVTSSPAMGCTHPANTSAKTASCPRNLRRCPSRCFLCTLGSSRSASLSMIVIRPMLDRAVFHSRDARRSKKPSVRAHDQENREVSMKRVMLGFAAAVCLVTPVAAQSNDPQPTCKMCPGTYIPVEELQAYTKKAIAEKRVDQQVRDVDIGKSHVAI